MPRTNTVQKILLLILPLFLAACTSTGKITKNISTYDTLQNQFHQIIAKTTPSIVAISTKSTLGDVGFGTGVVIDDGYILTCEHVIVNSDQINVLLSNQRIFAATVVGRDETVDLAVLKVDNPQDLVPIEFGNSDILQVGDIVFALGNAFGHSSHDGQPTVTQGIISALNRVATALSSGRRYWNAIQHDASVNPGNSGGPLVDMDGRMIGLNGVINSKSGNNAGVSFAVPMNVIKKYLPMLKKGEKIEHPLMGIADLNNVLTQIDDKEIRGVQIGVVSDDTPESKAGLKNLDIVIGADDVTIKNSVDFFNWFYNKDVGDEVMFQILRVDDKKTKVKFLTINFKLGAKPEN